MENFKVRCVGYNKSERYFTKGKVYEVSNGRITADNGFTYHCDTNDDVLHFLAPWYKFERVNTIERVIFNDPATIILWEDGTKTVAKCRDGDKYDAEKGFCIAYLKKTLGNTAFSEELHKWVKEEKPYKTKPPFKVGDKVKIINHRNDTWNQDGEMDKYMGKILTIAKTDYYTSTGYKCLESFGWMWTEKDFVQD